MDLYFPYLEQSFKHTPRLPFILIFLNFIEHIPVLSLLFFSSKILNKVLNKSIQWNENKISETFFLDVTLIPQFRDQWALNSSNVSLIVVIIINLLLIVGFNIYIIILKKNSSNKLKSIQSTSNYNHNGHNNNIHNTINITHLAHKIIVVVYDLLFFRLFSLYTMFLWFTIITNNIIDNLWFALIAMIILLIYIVLAFIFLDKVKLEIVFHKERMQTQNYPYNKFTSINDKIMFFIKIFLAWNAALYDPNTIIKEINATNLSYFYLFVALIPIVVIVAYLFTVYLLFAINKNYIIFHESHLVNVAKLFIAIYSVDLIVIDLWFNITFNSVFLIFGIISTLTVSVLIFRYLITLKNNKIFLHCDYLAQSKYWINWYFKINSNIGNNKSKINIVTGVWPNEVKYLVKVKMLIMNHFINCSRGIKCEFCNFINANIHDNSKIKSNILEFIELHYSYNKGRESFKKRKLDHDIIESFITINKNKHNYFALGLFYNKQAQYFKKKHQNIWYSLQWFYNKLFSHTEPGNDGIDCRDIINWKESETIIANLNKVIHLLENIAKYILFTPTGMIKASSVLIKYKKEWTAKWINKNEKNIQYQRVIMRYVCENVFNRKSKVTDTYSINNYDSYLQEHYHGDRFFVLKFDWESFNFTIYQTGKEFTGYINRKFDDWFAFKEIAKQALVDRWNESLGKNKDIFFEFPIKNIFGKKGKATNTNEMPNYNFPQHMWNVSSMIMKLNSLPSINCKEWYLNVLYKWEYKNILITMLSIETSEETILNYSESLRTYIIITPNIINELTKRKKNVLLNWVFAMTTAGEDGKIYFKYNKNKYHERLVEQWQEVGNDLALVSEEENFIIKNLNNYNKNTTETESTVQLPWWKREVFRYNSSSNIIFYYFRKNSLTYTKIGSIKATLNSQDTIKSDRDIIFNELNLYTAGTEASAPSGMRIDSSSGITNTQTCNTSVQSSYYQANPELYKQYIEEKKKKAKQNRQFTLFTYLILCANILLILITIVFWILEWRTNSKFRSSFSLFQDFNKFYRSFIGQSMNLLYNVCLSKPKELDCNPQFNSYSLELIDEFGLDSNFNVNSWIITELEIKLNDYNTMLQDINERIYESNDEESIGYANGIMKYRFLVLDYDQNNHEKIYWDEKSVTLAYWLRVYASLINIIVLEKSVNEVPIHIITISGNDITDIDISEIIFSQDALIKKIQKVYYQIIMNYTPILTELRKLRVRITTITKNNIELCKIIAVVFSLLLIFLHILLFGLCYYLFELFINMLRLHYSNITEKIGEKEKVMRWKEKWIIMKKLMLFYAEDPWGLISKHMNNNEKVEYHLKMQSKQNKVGQESQEIAVKKSNIQNLMSKEEFNALIKNQKISIHFIFVIYFIFAITYFVLFVYVTSSYQSIFSTFETNSLLDAVWYSQFSMLQLMIITNQKATELPKYINNGVKFEEGDNIIIRYSKMVFGYLESIEKAESEHQSRIIPMSKQYDLSCQGALKMVANDEIFLDMAKEFPNLDYLKQLEIWCEGYKALMFKSDKMWIKLILFNTVQNVNMWNYSYENWMSLNESREMFDLTIFVLLFFRPIRHYESTVLFLDYINDVNMRYNIDIYSYLIINSCFEIVLFVVLKLFIITKFINCNKGMNCLNKCINNNGF